MSREIKFRAWDKESKSMNDVSRIIIFPDKLDNGDICQVFRLYRKDWMLVPSEGELMQYTGLKDCKGVEIFEGDILKSVVSQNWYVVKFGDYAIGDEFENYEHHQGFYLCWGNYDNSNEAMGDIDKYCEVVGNVMENKELLK